jgi:transcriptional regulator with XRE-family HTH domain
VPELIAMPIGERVKRLRQQRGLTQQALAMKAGLSISAVIHIERGRIPDPRGSTLLALARGLGTTVDDLLSEGHAVDLLRAAPPEKPKRTRKPRGKKKEE